MSESNNHVIFSLSYRIFEIYVMHAIFSLFFLANKILDTGLNSCQLTLSQPSSFKSAHQCQPCINVLVKFLSVNHGKISFCDYKRNYFSICQPRLQRKEYSVTNCSGYSCRLYFERVDRSIQIRSANIGVLVKNLSIISPKSQRCG